MLTDATRHQEVCVPLVLGPRICACRTGNLEEKNVCLHCILFNPISKKQRLHNSAITRYFMVYTLYMAKVHLLKH